MDKNKVIGIENDLPWRIPNDWEYVKNITKRYPIILSQKKTGSIGRVLPDGRNIILTRDMNVNFDSCETAHSVEGIFEIRKNEEEVFIFEGEQIYSVSLPY